MVIFQDMRISGLKLSICIVLISVSTSAFAQKIQSWSSPAHSASTPYKKICLVGFNFNDASDSDIEDWLKAEIREHFNQVENVIIFNPEADSAYRFNSEYWISSVKSVPADVIFTYSISQVHHSEKAKKEKYIPLIQTPLKGSLWGYFTYNARQLNIPEDLVTKLKVEVNIYDYKTLHLIWSATSQPFSSENHLPTVYKLLEKMIYRATGDKVINDEI